jgi:hypothetical protein
MPTRAEVMRALDGAYRLARMDPSGMTLFDLSVDGFWRSFFAAVVALPGYAILITHELAVAPESDGLFGRILVRAVTYLVAWAAFPIAALILCRVLDVAGYYVPLIIAMNWAAVLQTYAFVAGLLAALILPGLLATPLNLAILGAVIFYQWFVIRTALQVSGPQALVFLLVDLVLSVLINLSSQ